MNSYLKFKKPIYDSCETLYYIKDIYLQTEPYNDLFSLTFNNMFKNKEDAYKELILYLYFEQDYDEYFDIRNIRKKPVTDEDISTLNHFLEMHLKQYGFSWEISEIKVLFNKEECR